MRVGQTLVGLGGGMFSDWAWELTFNARDSLNWISAGGDDPQLASNTLAREEKIITLLNMVSLFGGWNWKRPARSGGPTNPPEINQKFSIVVSCGGLVEHKSLNPPEINQNFRSLFRVVEHKTPFWHHKHIIDTSVICPFIHHGPWQPT